MTLQADAIDAETTLFAIRGEITFFNVDGLGHQLTEALQGGARNLIVDLTEVAFIDSSGLSALLTASAAARERGGTVALVHGARPPSIFRFRGVERLLALYESRAAALAGLR